MDTIKGVRLQPETNQRTHKISYYMNPRVAPKEKNY